MLASGLAAAAATSAPDHASAALRSRDFGRFGGRIGNPERAGDMLQRYAARDHAALNQRQTQSLNRRSLPGVP
jgi:hypothetical protein